MFMKALIVKSARILKVSTGKYTHRKQKASVVGVLTHIPMNQVKGHLQHSNLMVSNLNSFSRYSLGPSRKNSNRMEFLQWHSYLSASILNTAAFL